MRKSEANFPQPPLLFSLVLTLLSHMPLSMAHHLGGFVGWLFYRFPNRERRQAEINIHLCFPELSSKERENLLRNSLIESGKTLLEMPQLWKRDWAELESLIHNEEAQHLIQAQLRKGKGLIIATPHLGSWEALGLSGIHIQTPRTFLYRPPRQPRLEALMIQGRSRTGARLVPTNASGVKALYKALSANEIIGILPDQQPKLRKGKQVAVFAPFFNHPAYTMVLLSRLARKSGAPVIFQWAERLPKGKGYYVHTQLADPQISDPDLKIAAAALNRSIEACIRKTPSQYQWSYKRFDAQPDGRSPYRRK